MSAPLKILLACVPFGCDNIGDEAILKCAVKIFRRNFSNSEITVATARPTETARLLGVRAVGLLGFDRDISADSMRAELARHDVLVWCGATGLSDYPDTALEILETAQNLGLKTVLWGVGMDSNFNPAFFKLGGKKLKICRTLTSATLGKVNFVKAAENFLIARVRRRIRAALAKCDFVSVRDAQSARELAKCGVCDRVIVGADSAIELESAADYNPSSPEVRKILDGCAPKIGVCVSAQREVKNPAEMANALDIVLRGTDGQILFIPMNLKTDTKVMERLTSLMEFGGRTAVVRDCPEPSQVQKIASMCDVVVSSRLHLLILSANAATPPVGISRGSKLDNFLEPFGLKCASDVSAVDSKKLSGEILKTLLAGRDSFSKRRDQVYSDLKKRLDEAEKELFRTLK